MAKRRSSDAASQKKVGVMYKNAHGFHGQAKLNVTALMKACLQTDGQYACLTPFTPPEVYKGHEAKNYTTDVCIFGYFAA